MKNKMPIVLSFALIVSFTSCAQKQKNETEDYFRVSPLDGGKSLEITGYVETKQNVNIPSRLHGLPVAGIGNAVFAGKELIKVAIPNGVAAIGAEAFAKNPLTSVSISADNPTYVIKDNFLLSKDEKSLILYFGSEENVTIPDGITTISPGAFSSKQLTGITIPDSVTVIGDREITG